MKTIMRHRGLGMAMVALVAAGAGVVGTRELSKPQQGARDARIATLDLQQVVGDYLAHTGDMTKLEEQFQTDQLAVGALNDSIEAMVQEVTVFPPGSKEYQALEKKIAIERARVEVESRANRAHHDRRQAKLLADVYDKVHETVRIYSTNNKIDVVHLTTEPRIQGESRTEVTNAMVVRSVVYSHDRLDITERIKAELKR